MTPASAQRILQICPHDSAPFGALVQLYQQAAATLQLDVENVILGQPAGSPLPGTTYLGLTDLSQTRAISQALNAWSQQNWTLVLCHRYRAYWAVVRSRLGRRPHQSTIAVAHEYGLLERWQRRVNRRLWAPQVQFAGVSAPVAQELAAITGQHLVLPNGLDAVTNRARLETRVSARQFLGVPDDCLVVGVVGRLHYKKRPQLALQGFAQFCRTQSAQPARLVFLGEGEQRAELQQMADALNAELAHVDVHLPGVVPDAQRYMCAFDVLLYPAVADSFGMVALEAMDAGVPVVCKPGHGPGAVLGDLGNYVEQDTPDGYAAALVKALAQDPAALLLAGRQRVDQQFSVSAVARALDAVLIEASS